MYASRVVVVIAVPSAQLQQSLGLGKALAISGEGYCTKLGLTIKNPAPVVSNSRGWVSVVFSSVVVEGLCVLLEQPDSPCSHDDVP
jgi:hypothetical protein